MPGTKAPLPLIARAIDQQAPEVLVGVPLVKVDLLVVCPGSDLVSGFFCSFCHTSAR